MRKKNLGTIHICTDHGHWGRLSATCDCRKPLPAVVWAKMRLRWYKICPCSRYLTIQLPGQCGNLTQPYAKPSRYLSGQDELVWDLRCHENHQFWAKKKRVPLHNWACDMSFGFFWPVSWPKKNKWFEDWWLSCRMCTVHYLCHLLVRHFPTYCVFTWLARFSADLTPPTKLWRLVLP